jgi:peptide deformylase
MRFLSKAVPQLRVAAARSFCDLASSFEVSPKVLLKNDKNFPKQPRVVTAEDLQDPKFSELIYAMRTTIKDLLEYPAISAPQLGVPLQVVMWRRRAGNNPDAPYGGLYRCLFNPEISFIPFAAQDERYEQNLSVPGYAFKISRPTEVLVNAMDSNGRFNHFPLIGEEARLCQQFYDLFNGVWIDESPLQINHTEKPRSAYAQKLTA